MRKTALLFALLIPVPMVAQSALTIPPQQCVWKQGDDSRWAAPGIDESDWQPVSAWTGISTPTPNFWLRCRFQSDRLAPAVHPALQVAGDLAWQVFADGRSIGQSGNLVSGAHTAGMVADYRAPELSQRNRPIAVAVRMSYSPQMNGEQPLPQLALGDAELQQGRYYAGVYQRVKKQWVTWACYALITSAGLFFLALFWFDRTQRYLLWVSLTWLALADLRLNEFLVSASVHYSSRLEFFLYVIGQNVPVFAILFFFALNQRPLPRIYRFFLALNLLEPILLMTAFILPLHPGMDLRWWAEINPWTSSADVVATLTATVSPIVSFWPIRALRKWQIPLATVCYLWMLMDVAYMVVQFPFLNLDIQNMFLRIQPYRSVAITVVVISLTFLLVQRLRSTNRERATLHGEMQAAGQIQRLLVPGTIDSAAGWSIDAAFLPAREVGGDFYLCRALPNGRLRIVIGDVSGKGAAAAMTAALLIGAAEKRESDSPTELLRHLNLVLCDSHVGGFATCLCADLAADGAIVAASAGHLAPYFNGAEMAIENDLPLGLNADASYPASTFQFSAGSRLTFLTDGVVEARGRSGELFGFERTASLSTGSAGELARAAEAFGQQDDITVLALTRLAAPQELAKKPRVGDLRPPEIQVKP